MAIVLVLTFAALLIGLAVLGTTLIYVVGIALSWLSILVRKHETELRNLIKAGDICTELNNSPRKESKL